MKDKKRKLVNFSFYDRSGMERYLERQAAEGWLLEKISSFGWRFRRIEPKKIHFSVTYFPKASAFDPEPSEQLRAFQDFCEHTGWKLASSNAQLQIFFNEQEDPIPIATDAVLEVEQIHTAVKKGFLPSYAILLLSGLLQAALFFWRLSEDPVGVLSSNANLFSGACWMLLLLMVLTEVIGYFRWHKRAKAAAELDGSFLETRGHSYLQLLILGAILAAFCFLLASYSGSGMGLLILSIMAMILGITTAVLGVSELMKKLKWSARVNRTVTIVLTVVLAFGVMGVVLIAAINHINALFSEKTAETYEYNGHTWSVYHDTLPLTLEDLTDMEYDAYSYWLQEDGKSLLAEHMEAVQRPRMDALEQPDLEYSVTTVKLPLLYGWCKQALLEDFAHNYGRPDPEDSMWKQEAAVDPAPWGAGEAYQLLLGGEPQMRFLLCYDKRIVEIGFPYDWNLTEEQMAAVARCLGE